MMFCFKDISWTFNCHGSNGCDSFLTGITACSVSSTMDNFLRYCHGIRVNILQILATKTTKNRFKR